MSRKKCLKCGVKGRENRIMGGDVWFEEVKLKIRDRFNRK